LKINNQFDALFAAAAFQYGVPFEWLKGIAGAESDWVSTAYRAEPQINDGSYGLMQILMRTARSLGYTGDSAGLYDPQTNIGLGAKLLAENIQRFGMDFNAVYSAYNSGSATAYMTNSQVAAHVNRAVTYLNAVLTDIAAASDSGVAADEINPDTGSVSDTGSINTETVVGIGGAALAIAIAAGLYFLTIRG
jgi:soluble lytic murein transglycosylase-like protein